MSDIVGRLRDRLRAEQRVDADGCWPGSRRCAGFLDAVDGHLPDDRLGPARTLVERAGARLELSRDHTLVALAGATGSGKSSLFNAVARLDLSPVGVRRPTTGVAHACVWGPLEGANKLLDWIGVLPRHRFIRESPLDADDESALHGLVLLDLPDFDSVQQAHRLEADRLLALVDLVIWVVDPQKYADRVVHDSYLREFHRHRDVTVVVLNQADRLSPAELPKVLADLRRLLDADGLTGVPLLATSALDPDAVLELRATLEQTVAERQAALRKLAGDLDAVVDRPGRRLRRARHPAPASTTPPAGDWSGPSPAPPGCRRWPPRCARRTGTGRPGRPAGRWCAAGAGCARTRCAGCTCPAAANATPSRPPARRAWSRRPRCRCRPRPPAPRWGSPYARSPNAPPTVFPRRGRPPPAPPPGCGRRTCRTRWTGRSPVPNSAWTGGRSGGGWSAGCSGWSPSPRSPAWPGSPWATCCACSACPNWTIRRSAWCRCRRCCCSAGCWPGSWWPCWSNP